jgi:hypothetical protein
VLVNVTVAVVAVLLDVAVEVTAAFISWAEQTARPQASANKTNEVLMLMAEQFWVCNLLTLQCGIAKQRRIEKVQLQRRQAVTAVLIAQNWSGRAKNGCCAPDDEQAEGPGPGGDG